MNVVVVYNPASGSALPRNELKKLFTENTIVVDEWIDITNNPTLRLAEWRVKKCVVVAIGGDGTLANVANMIHGGNAVFAPLPGGTLNHFTKDAGINQDIAAAIRALPASTPKTIDIATINGRVFLNNSSIGIYPVSLRTRRQFEDRLGKWTAAVVGSVRALIQFRLYEVTVNDSTFKTPFLFVGNNEYHLDQGVRRTSLTEGMLSVYAIKSDKRRALLSLLGAALRGNLQKHRDLLVLKTTHVIIRTDRPQVHASTDGEVTVQEQPLTYECIRGGLTIIGSS